MLLFGYGGVSAEVQSPYTVDFSTSINTTAHDFKVAPGWGHIVSSYSEYWDETYISYTYSTTGGVDNSACLKVPAQQSLGDYGDYSTTDLLVTPAVMGEVSLMVKKTSAYSTSAIKFYAVTKSTDGKFVKGDEITPSSAPTLSEADYVKYVLPTQSNAYIGIWGSNVYIDDFAAGSADIVLSKGLTISSASVSQKYPNCDADNNFTVTMDVTVKNTGEVTLNPNDENYSVSILFGSSNEVVGIWNIPTALAVGESTTVSVTSKALDFATYGGTNRFNAKENITGTVSSSYIYVSPVAYVPKLVVRNDDGIVSSGTTLAFGKITETATKVYTLSNEGAAPLKITSITMPEGFTSSLTAAADAPLTIKAGENETLTITMPVDVKGVKNGEMVITSESLDDFKLSLSGTVLDPSKFYVNFDDGQIPDGCIAGEDWEVVSGSNWNTPYILQSKVTTLTKFITPLLEVAEGEKMSFMAGKQVGTSTLNVYYSSDRQTWTLIKTIENEDFPSKQNGSYWSGYYYDLADFVIEGVPAGKYYIAFESGYANVDEIYGFTRVAVDHDLMITTSKVPTSGMVNNKYTATATLKNINTTAETNYTAELCFGDEVVATAEASEIAAGEVKDFSFSFTPHEAGTYKACVKFTFGTTVVKSADVDVVIGEEIGSKDVVAGNAESTTTKSNAPVRLNYKQSESETIYTADVLNLKAGDKITGLTYLGYKTSDDLTTTVSIWLQNTEDAEYTAGSYAEASKADMTKVYDDSYTWVKKGSSSELLPMLQVNLSEPFVYTGKNLRIVVRSEATAYKSVEFQCEESDQTHCIYRSTDNGVLDEQTYYSTNLPVVTLSIATDPQTISGTVTDTYSAPIENAAVKLVSDDVIYNGTTDAEGKYSINVIQTGLVYNATYTAEGYDAKTEENITFADGSIADKNVVLTAQTPVYTVGQPTLVCLPAAVTSDASFGQFYSMKKYKDNVLSVSPVETTEAGVPYIFIPATATPFDNISSITDAPSATSVVCDGITFTGSYSAKTLMASDAISYYGISGADDKTAALAATDKVMPYGAYFSTATALTELPTIKFMTEPRSISGIVADAYDAPISGATVELKSGDVAYNATTKADGSYEITVEETDLTYTATYTADGYKSKTIENVSFAEGNLSEQNVKLSALAPTFTVGQPALVCLPMEVSSNATLGNFYTVESFADGVVTVKLATTIAAGTPCVFVPATATPFDETIDVENAPKINAVSVDGLTLNGTYSAMSLADGIYYGISGADDKSAALTGVETVNPYGAYFSTTEKLSSMPTVKFVDNTSSISSAALIGGTTDGNVYTIDGRKVGTNVNMKSLKKGLYIIGGKKVVVK